MDSHDQKAHKYFELAKFNAELFSKDPHTKVGALVMKPDFSCILSTGINGLPRKVDDENPSRWERPTKYSYVAHAEINAICNAARSGTPIDGASVIITMFSCCECCKALIQSGIKKVYAPEPDLSHHTWGESFKASLEMFREAGVEIVWLKDQNSKNI